MKLRKRFGVVLVLAMLVSVLAMTMTASAAKKAKKTKISQKTATISVGKSVKLSVKNAKGKKVTWKSEDEDIAKVGSSGKVTGLAGGEATIVAKVGGKNYKCAVTVKAVKFENLNKEEPRIELKSYSGNAGNADVSDLWNGYTQYDLKANLTVYPAGLAVKWSTSDAKVATVENGVVKAVANGTCTVTAEATDGSGAKDTVVIWVTQMGQGTNSTNPIIINGENKATEFDKYFAKLKVTAYVYDKDGKLLKSGTEVKAEALDGAYQDMFDDNLFYSYDGKAFVGVPAMDKYYYYLKDTSIDRRKSSASVALGFKRSEYKVYLADKDGKPVDKPIIEYQTTQTGQNGAQNFDPDYAFPAKDYFDIKYKNDKNEWVDGSVRLYYSVAGLTGKSFMVYNYGTTYFIDKDTAYTYSDEVVNSANAVLYK